MKALVIGAGFSGCCAAVLLREALAAEVTVIERASVPGGMLRTLYTAEGAAYEAGPRVVSVFRGTPDLLPFLRRYLSLEGRAICQGTRLAPDYPVVPFPVDRESIGRLPCAQTIERELAAIRDQGGPPGERNLLDYLETSVGPTLTGGGSTRYQRFGESYAGSSAWPRKVTTVCPARRHTTIQPAASIRCSSGCSMGSTCAAA